MSDAVSDAGAAMSDDDDNGELPVVDTDVDSDAAFDSDPDSDPDVNADSSIDGEISELDAVTQERDQFKDIALRLQADFENYRKRMTVQSVDDVDRATGRLAEALLPVLDAAEAAYVQHPDEVGPLLSAVLTELKKHGLEALDLEGQPFDPVVAEAVTHEPVDGGDVVVSEVMRSGYRWKGRTLRPAMVRTRD